MINMTTWELAEKPRRKTRQFAVVIKKQGDLFVTELKYFGKKPYGSMGFIQREFTNTKDMAHKVGQMMLKDLKRGKLDRFIDEDLKAEAAWRKMGRIT